MTVPGYLEVLYMRAAVLIAHENSSRLNKYEVKLLKSIVDKRLHRGTVNQARFVDRTEIKLIK